MEASKTSSTKKGIIRAPAKGQPSRLPKANQKMPWAVLMPPCQSMKAENPSMVVYMAKLEGRYAGEAWYIPGLNIMTMRKYIATREFMVLDMAEYSRVSHTAHSKASTTRRK